MCCEPVRQTEPSFFGPSTPAAHIDVDPVPASVGIARQFVRDASAGVGDELADVLVLLTSELVTNAVLHARTPVQVGVVVDDEHVLVAVSDRVRLPAALVPRAYSHERLGGRGLAIVADASDEWGTTFHSGGKSVWFRLARQSQSVSVG